MHAFFAALWVALCSDILSVNGLDTPARTIPKIKNLHFELDGEVKYWAGTNAYWLPYLTKDADVDLVLDHMADAQLRIVRIWGFNDIAKAPANGTVWFQSFIPGAAPEINTGPLGLQRLDYVVRAAEKRGIKFVIPFVNNWDDYGGMTSYMQYCLNIEPVSNDLLSSSEKSSWYTNQKCQEQYQKYVKTVVTRYLDSPAIFAWELANEPRCGGCNTTVVTEWARKTSAYIKSLDKKHMVAVGDEGFGLNTRDDAPKQYPYEFYEGTDFAALVALPDIDMGTFHLYPDHWGITLEWGNEWIQNHAAACVAAQKPCLFEEYGVMAEEKCSQEVGWQKLALKTPGVAGDMYWQYGDTISSGKTADDKFTVFRGTENWDCMIDSHGQDIKSLPAVQISRAFSS